MELHLPAQRVWWDEPFLWIEDCHWFSEDKTNDLRQHLPGDLHIRNLRKTVP
jgi:hypothetical protein